MLEVREYEVIEGRKHTMSPTNFFHYVASDNISAILKAHLNKAEYQLTQDVCLIPDGFSGVKLFPDVAVFKKPCHITAKGAVTDIPLFVAEVISPSSRAKDTNVKLRLYAEIGVSEYWLADPYGKYVTSYLLDRETERYDCVCMIQKLDEEDLSDMSEEERAEHSQVIKLNFLNAEININEIFTD